MGWIPGKLMATSAEPGDYSENGLLMCHRCHEPKQARVSIDGKDVLVPVLCRCQSEAEAMQKEDAAAKRFRGMMKQLWEDSISCPDALRYTFQEDDGKDAKISNACKRYVERWEEMSADNIGILFHGTVGTGKTFFASCIGNGLLKKRVSVAATNFPRLLNLLHGAQEKQKLLDRLRLYSLLIVDDLGVERDSGFAMEQVFNVIDARAVSGLPLIVTTNLTLDELERPASMQAARIYDRVLELCPVRFKLTGESRRHGNAEERKRKARELLLDKKEETP